MDIFPDDEFLAWFFTYFMDDINCPHCNALISRGEIETSYSEGDDFVLCPHCDEQISKNDLEG